MATQQTKIKKQSNQLVGRQAKPVPANKSPQIDIDLSKELLDDIISEGLTGGLDTTAIENFTSVSTARDRIYQLEDIMAQDSAVSSILRTYAEDATELADNGHIIWAESTDSTVSKFVNYILNTMNADKHIYSWAYSLVKYGDIYLKLFRESDYIDPFFDKNKINTRETLAEEYTYTNTNLNEDIKLHLHDDDDPYSYYVELVSDPCSMFELTKYGKTFGFIEVPVNDSGNNYLENFLVGNGTASNVAANYKMRSNDVHLYQATDFVHACLEDNNTRYPEKVQLFLNNEDYDNNANSQSYTVKRGKSLLFDNYKVWREKTLLEDSILLNRVTKSSVVRNIQVEVGNMSKEQARATLSRVKDLFEQHAAINTTGNGNMAEYTNPGPAENNIYTTTHGGQGAISVNSVGGDVEVKNLADLDQWINKFYAGFGIPKQFFSQTDDGAGFNGGTSLSITSSIFAKGVKKIQNALIQALTDAINLFLIGKGFKSYINKFVLKMKVPLTQEEKDYRDDLSNRINAISSFQGLLSDVESRSRKLKIIKSLISTLNYGDDITQELDAEIEAAEQQEKDEKRKAEEEAKLNAQMQNNEQIPDLAADTKDKSKEEPELSETDLADIDLPPIPTESFNSNGGNTTLVEGPDFNVTNDTLPTPEELNEKKDFTKNN